MAHLDLFWLPKPLQGPTRFLRVALCRFDAHTCSDFDVCDEQMLINLILICNTSGTSFSLLVDDVVSLVY